ncbi:MAG: hypothetical protein KC620_12610, partial [Myxococcales bacterium]|nr:hypothetical protein [Myxococcales bacterium]
RSDTGDFSRTTPLSYAYADLAFSFAFIALLLAFAPSRWALLPGAVTGVAAVLVDAVWFYRAGRREVIVDGQRAGPAFIAWWLVGYFDFLIAFNLGCYVGWVLLVGLLTPAGLAVTAGFWLWFCVATPTAARLLWDAGCGRAIVTTVRRVGRRGTWMRLVVALAASAVLCVTLLRGDVGAAAELFAVGVLTAGAMETPLYMLGIRPGADAWKAWALNSLCEWNYAVPVLYALLHAVGVRP